MVTISPRLQTEAGAKILCCALFRFFLFLGPGVFQADGLVEDEMAILRIGVHGIVAQTRELIVVAGLGPFGRPRFQLGVHPHLEAVGIEEVSEISLFGRRVLH